MPRHLRLKAPCGLPSTALLPRPHVDNRITRFKLSLQYLVPPTYSTPDVLDTCLSADFILLLLSSTVEVPESSLNTLRSILSQGTPSIIPIVANLTFHSNPKMRAEVRKSHLTYIQQYIPTAERVFAADDRGEASTVMRMVCTGIPVGIRWREQRSYLLPEGWRWDADEGKVVCWGTIRGKPLEVDRLIHLPSYGDFQIDKVILITNGVLISDMFFTRRRHEQGKDIDGC